MAKSKLTGLGRGLEAIFEDNSADSGLPVSSLRLSELEPRADQPRKNFDQEALSQLADSIATHGLIQPVVVRPSENGFYQIIAGERRWRASKMAGLTEIPVIIIEADDKKAAQLALIENIQRENLNAIEEAEAYRSLIEEHKLTQEEISRQVSKSRSAVTNSLRLLDLPEEVIAMVEDGALSAGHARTLLGLRRQNQIAPTAATAVNKGMSVRALEALVRSMNKLSDDSALTAPPAPEKLDYISELSRRMSKRLGRRVLIFNNNKNKHIDIQYLGNEDLEQIIKRLCGDNIFDED